jgi:hypothetical protein
MLPGKSGKPAIHYGGRSLATHEATSVTRVDQHNQDHTETQSPSTWPETFPTEMRLRESIKMRRIMNQDARSYILFVTPLP